MADASDDALQSLQTRLKKLETELVAMFESTQDDLRLARALQAQLMPNRLPEIIGVQSQARYISARELSSESYDLIPVHRNRELWIVQSWTSSFGLSSILLQSLVHTKSVELVQTAQGPSVEKVFDDLSEALTDAQKKGSYRLLVARLDLNKLVLDGVAIGQAPVLVRRFSKGSLGPMSYVAPEAHLKDPSLLKRASSLEPLSSLRAYRFSQTLEAGSRIFMLGSEWNANAGVEKYAEPLHLQSPAASDRAASDRAASDRAASETGDDLLSNINRLAMSMEDHLKSTATKADITVIGFELNARLLHLA